MLPVFNVAVSFKFVVKYAFPPTGKGWPLGSSLWCLIVSLSLSNRCVT